MTRPFASERLRAVTGGGKRRGNCASPEWVPSAESRSWQKEQNRDISEKIALGLAKPTQSTEGMYDSRLFNQTSGFDSGINEDNPYDKPLFAAQEAISSIYRSRANAEDDEGEGDEEMAKIQKASRFGEVLGRGTFKGAKEAEAREGPVQFEKEKAAATGNDPFGETERFLTEMEQSASSKRRLRLAG